MSECSNCFNGCTETTSDKCIKYTGVDFPLLDISTGDSFASIETKIFNYLISSLNGTGIKFNIAEENLCEIIDSNLEQSEDTTIIDIVSAITKSICTLNETIVSLSETIEETSYNADCLEITENSTTHEVLQILITEFCLLSTEFSEFRNTVEANYVLVEDINEYIQNYLNNSSTTTTTTIYNPLTTTTTTSGPITTTTTTTAAFYNQALTVGYSAPVGWLSACYDNIPILIVYSLNNAVALGSVLYTDTGLTTPYDGNSLWYKNAQSNKSIQINELGEIIDIYSC